MNVAVCVKQIPDPAVPGALSADHTLDRSGKILSETPCAFSRAEIDAAVVKMQGEFVWPVPLFSAAKIDGKKLYEYGRSGEAIEASMSDQDMCHVTRINVKHAQRRLGTRPIIKSPVMGGLSKWNVLRDPELSQAMPEVFGAVPEVVAGLLRHEAENVWSKWNPFYWSAIRLGGYLGGDPQSGCEHLPAISQRRGFFRRLFALHSHKA